MVIKDENAAVDPSILSWLDDIANLTKADIFLVDPAERNDDGGVVANSKEQLKFVIYGDMLTKENAKIRILIMIDQMVCWSLSSGRLTRLAAQHVRRHRPDGARPSHPALRPIAQENKGNRVLDRHCDILSAHLPRHPSLRPRGRRATPPGRDRHHRAVGAAHLPGQGPAAGALQRRQHLRQGRADNPDQDRPSGAAAS